MKVEARDNHRHGVFWVWMRVGILLRMVEKARRANGRAGLVPIVFLVLFLVHLPSDVMPEATQRRGETSEP